MSVRRGIIAPTIFNAGKIRLKSPAITGRCWQSGALAPDERGFSAISGSTRFFSPLDLPGGDGRIPHGMTDTPP
jgi:hypothetical protein